MEGYGFRYGYLLESGSTYLDLRQYARGLEALFTLRKISIREPSTYEALFQVPPETRNQHLLLCKQSKGSECLDKFL